MKSFGGLCAATSLGGVLLLAAQSSQAALIGISTNEPVIDVPAGAIVDYNASTGVVTISGEPSSIFRSDPFLLALINGASTDNEKLVTVQLKVDGNGNFVSGVTGPDVIIKGSIDVDGDGVNDYDGTLLQGEVVQFGFENHDAPESDFFDVRVTGLTGALAPLYAGQDLGIAITSEASDEFPTPFNGSFAADFVGAATATCGAATPLSNPGCALNVEAKCSVDGGPFKDKCRIKVTRSAKHWDWEERRCNSHTYKRYVYGYHGDPEPSWASRYGYTYVTFRYVVSNTGTTTVTDLTVDDAFDTPIAGVPASLAPGQSVTLTRVEKLREEIENSVVAAGVYQTASCGDTDTVVVKDKLRERRRHDYDRFRDKGDRDNYDVR
jgi:hypothetical protein